MSLLLCTSLLLLWVHAVWSGSGGSSARRSVVSHHLNLVYGSERIDLHFLSHDQLDQAVQKTQLSQKEEFNTPRSDSFSRHRSLFDSVDDNHPSDDLVSQLTCVLYRHGPEAKETLSNVFGHARVSTVHVSQGDNRACFLISTSSRQLEEMMGGGTAASTDATGHNNLHKLGLLDFTSVYLPCVP